MFPSASRLAALLGSNMRPSFSQYFLALVSPTPGRSVTNREKDSSSVGLTSSLRYERTSFVCICSKTPTPDVILNGTFILASVIWTSMDW